VVFWNINKRYSESDTCNFSVSIEGRENVEIEYNPADTSVRYVCPRCKLDLKIKLKTGVMEEIATK
jgi:Zn-finger nucleic acid-binding protein